MSPAGTTRLSSTSVTSGARRISNNTLSANGAETHFTIKKRGREGLGLVFNTLAKS
jgi:hypothetical protein